MFALYTCFIDQAYQIGAFFLTWDTLKTRTFPILRVCYHVNCTDLAAFGT
jgi:hypothetical protein